MCVHELCVWAGWWVAPSSTQKLQMAAFSLQSSGMWHVSGSSINHRHIPLRIMMRIIMSQLHFHAWIIKKEKALEGVDSSSPSWLCNSEMIFSFQSIKQQSFLCTLCHGVDWTFLRNMSHTSSSVDHFLHYFKGFSLTTLYRIRITCWIPYWNQKSMKYK